MRFSILTPVALIASLVSAAPAGIQDVAARETYPNVPVTFNAAGGVSYTIVVVANNVPVATGQNELSIISISMEGRASFTCTSYGSEGSVTHLVASQQNVPVGPPQPQVSVSCSAPPTP